MRSSLKMGWDACGRPRYSVPAWVGLRGRLLHLYCGRYYIVGPLVLAPLGKKTGAPKSWNDPAPASALLEGETDPLGWSRRAHKRGLQSAHDRARLLRRLTLCIHTVPSYRQRRRSSIAQEGQLRTSGHAGTAYLGSCRHLGQVE